METELDKLHLLVELLSEFNLPVSPVLQYAIQEKIDLLSSGKEYVVINQTKEDNDDIENNDLIEQVPITKPKNLLRITMPDGNTISEEKATATFLKAIQYVGVNKVFDLHIPMEGDFLVSKTRHPIYASAQKNIDGFLIIHIVALVTKNASCLKSLMQCNLIGG